MTSFVSHAHKFVLVEICNVSLYNFGLDIYTLKWKLVDWIGKVSIADKFCTCRSLLNWLQSVRFWSGKFKTCRRWWLIQNSQLIFTLRKKEKKILSKSYQNNVLCTDLTLKNWKLTIKYPKNSRQKIYLMNFSAHFSTDVAHKRKSFFCHDKCSIFQPGFVIKRLIFTTRAISLSFLASFLAASSITKVCKQIFYAQFISSKYHL